MAPSWLDGSTVRCQFVDSMRDSGRIVEAETTLGCDYQADRSKCEHAEGYPVERLDLQATGRTEMLLVRRRTTRATSRGRR